MKKKTVGLLLALMTAVSLTACGTKNIANEAVAMESNIIVTEETGLIVEELPIPETIETEEPVYIDYEDLYLADNYLKVGREKLEAVDTDSLESTFEKYALSDSVDIYNSEGYWIGLTKPNIEVLLFGTNDKWAEVSFLKTILYVPKDIFTDVATPKAGIILYRDEEPEEETSDVFLAEAEETTSKQETTPSKPKTEIPAPATTEPVVVEPSTTEPVVVEPEPVVIESDKYTPEEAVAVYRSIMEANGISWNPALKNGGSWGTGWFYLKKGWIDENAYQNVEVFKMGGGDSTRPWRSFYMEITGSDENAVYFTQWHA